MRIRSWVVFLLSFFGCQRAGHDADASRVPPGHGWFASTIDLGACTRACETRPGAMTASGTAPVPECAPVATAYCYTFQGPSNAGLPVRCKCDAATCERDRASIVKTDYGAPITDVSRCTAEP